MVTGHDFGAGPVAAHRHTNRDGTEGGWVADTAHVAATAYIGPDARVYDTARVSGLAWVYDTARVFGSAWVSGSARVFGSAWVSGSAWVFDTRHVLTVGPVGSEGRTVTAFRTVDGHEVNAGCWTGTVDELAARVAPGGDHGWGDDEGRWRADYESVVALIRVRVAEWDAERLAVAS